MDSITLFSTIAGISMAICQIPQAMQFFRGKSAADHNIAMQMTFCLGVTSWLIVGILLNNAPMYLSNGFSGAFGYYILWRCFADRYKQKKVTSK